MQVPGHQSLKILNQLRCSLVLLGVPGFMMVSWLTRMVLNSLSGPADAGSSCQPATAAALAGRRQAMVEWSRLSANALHEPPQPGSCCKGFLATAWVNDVALEREAASADCCSLCVVPEAASLKLDLNHAHAQHT
jgi:hypothetical protein